MKEFVKGLFAKMNEKAPEFVICNLSFKVEDFEEWAKANANEKGYVNIDILKSRDAGKLYAQLNDFKKEETKVEQQEQKNDFPF